MFLMPKEDRNGGLLGFVDMQTQETVIAFREVTLRDDFVGSAAIPAAGAPMAGYPWVKKIVATMGVPSVAFVANACSGVVALALDAAAEKQEATLYSNDQRNWDVTKGLYFEARMAMASLPSAPEVEAVLGLQSAWADGPDNGAAYLRIRILGSGRVYAQSNDGINVVSCDSKISVLPGELHIFAIDAADPTGVAFYADGIRLDRPGTMAFSAIGDGAILQPYASVYKGSGAGVATMQIDSVTIATDRA